MATETEIANLALLKMGSRSTITSLAEDSNEAEKANQFYSSTRDELLQMANWGFNESVVALTLRKQAPGTIGGVASNVWTDDYPKPPWLYEYDRPSNALMIRAIVPVLSQSTYPYLLAAATAFQMSGDVIDDEPVEVILTNQQNAIAVYIKRVIITTLFPPLFVEALTSALAAKLAIPLSGDKELAKTWYAIANVSVRTAQASAANQNFTMLESEASWILARQNPEDLLVYPGNWVAPYAPLYMT